MREGPRWPPGSTPRHQAGVGGQRLGHELRLAVRPRHRGHQPRFGARRLLAEHRRGRALASPPPRRRAGLPDRDGLLRLPGREGPVRAGPPGRPGRREPRPRHRDQAQPGGQARSRGRAARRQGQPRDRRHPGCAGRGHLCQPVPTLRLLGCRFAARLRRGAGRDHRAARRDQVGRGRGWLLGGPGRRDGPRRPGRRLHQHRWGRGRHRCRPSGVQRPRLAALPGGVLPGLPPLRRAGRGRRRGVRAAPGGWASPTRPCSRSPWAAIWSASGARR